MEEDVVGAAVGATIQVVLQSLLMKAIEEINLRGSFKKEMKKLKGELDMIQAYLSDAEKLRVQKEAVKLWLYKLECVAFKAYTVLDKINYHRLQAQVENLKKRKFSSLLFSLSSSNPIVFRSKMARKIREINEELRNMSSLTDWVDPEVATTIFPCLKDLSILSCPRLKSAQSHFPCLKVLTFGNVDLCSPLTHICDGNLTSLERLLVYRMPGLISLPDGLFVKNQNLKYLEIQSCPNLKRLAPCSLSLEYLGIHECENLRELFIDLHRLQSLKELIISECPKLRSISYQNNGESQGGFISLKELCILDCQELTTLPLEMLKDCGEKLEIFDLRDLPNLTYPSEMTAYLPKMTHLSRLGVYKIPKLMNFPIDCNSLSGLKDFDITPFSDSRDIFYNTLRGIFQVSQSLQKVSLHGNECWGFLPDQLQHLTALQELFLTGFGLMEVLPEWLGNISSLRVLVVSNCKKLRDLPSKETIQRLTNLRHLWIMDSPLVKEKYSETQWSETQWSGNAASNSVWSKDFPSLKVKIS